ncbi:Arm DNA-binding domain-containing protein [Methylocystis parvus]|uniref:Arm DNA-binding domain-containing protein n=1 Tax=Methylocystis parvus TaxID=134 RepID=UPI000316E75A|nr:Arm DNA-binding domain-containing protein [Methylocystis parvus]
MAKEGKHPEKALTAIKIRNLSKAGRYADGNGLYLVVDPSGAKRWLLRTVVQGRRRDIGLGGLSLVSLAEAREKALSYRKLAREGGNPLAEKRRDAVVIPTFAEAAQHVFDEHQPSWKNGKHAAQWMNTLRQYAAKRELPRIIGATRASHPIALPQPAEDRFMFATGVECSYPTLEGGRWRALQSLRPVLRLSPRRLAPVTTISNSMDTMLTDWSHTTIVARGCWYRGGRR